MKSWSKMIKKKEFRKYSDLEFKKQSRRLGRLKFFNKINPYHRPEHQTSFWEKSKNIHPVIAMALTFFFTFMIFAVWGNFQVDNIVMASDNAWIQIRNQSSGEQVTAVMQEIDEKVSDWNGRDINIRFIELGIWYYLIIGFIQGSVSYYPGTLSEVNGGEE